MITISHNLRFIAVCSFMIMPATKIFAASHLPLQQAPLTFYLSERIKLLFRKKTPELYLKILLRADGKLIVKVWSNDGYSMTKSDLVTLH